jgi:acyl-CoA oxidase
LLNKQQRYFLGRTQLFERGLKCVRAMYDLKATHALSDEDFELAFYLFGEDLPIQLQVSVFVPCLKALASDEQLAKWLPLAQRYEMIGSYAQTELSHGSNVAGLQTEARYDPETDEFVLHTPSPEATKWWIGQLGKCANHTVLFAQLLMPDSSGAYRSYGPHPFLVQVRRYEDHTVIPGIRVGDIGPKMGFAALDNGFISFDHHRIPRSNMLSRYAKIDPVTKKYVAPSNAKLLYGSMLAVRVGIASSSSMALQAASTIAVRYSAVRRQFSDPMAGADSEEKQVLDYLSQQYKILPQLATAYAMAFTGRWMSNMFKKLNADFAKGDFSLLPAMHASSSGMKSLLTSLTAEGIEACRMALGGHGYSLFSGLPMMYTSFVHVCTAEGENWLLNQQTVRQLLKLLQAANANVASSDGHQSSSSSQKRPSEFHPEDPASYLLRHPAHVVLSAKCQAKSPEDWTNPKVYLDALEHRATRLLGQIALGLQEAMSDSSPSKAWDQHLIEIHSAARAHCFAVMAQIFVAEVEKDKKNLGPGELQVLQKIAALFAVYVIEKDIGQFTEDQFVSASQAKDLRKTLKKLLGDIREEAVSLADAFQVSDYSLNSALGDYDANPYETMLKWKDQEPLNQVEVLDAFKTHIQPLIHKNRAKL